MVKILIIDRQRSVRNILKERLEFEGYKAEAVEDLQGGRALAQKIEFGVVLCEEIFFREYVSAPGAFPETCCLIVLSDSADVNAAVGAMRSGAFDFVAKPVDMNYLYAAIKRAAAESDGESSSDSSAMSSSVAATAATRPKKSKATHVEDIIGDSKPIMLVKQLISKVAPSEARVLVTGPNGTGKELVARWLHEKSPRCEGPFIEVNCAAIPSELIESELFGHEKGSFTSAIKQRKGKFEQANGGTLFLDEIGDMSLSAQAKVLRALQENRITRVGGDKDLDVDVRIVSATNKNLREEITKGNFREDLYHRLSVIVINVPPLVDRLNDIPLLVDYFVEKISLEYGISPKQIDHNAVEELKTMDWTGNIRELRNVIERLLILSGDQITYEDVRTYAVGAN